MYTLSRSNKEDFGPRAKHINLDLTSSAQDMAEDVKGVEADYVFFAAYLEKADEREATRVNGDMLDSFCKALEINGSASKIKRFVLVCGAKNYGVHLGRVKIPMQETDPWLPEPPFPSNFYYRQQNILHAYCEKHNIEWNTLYAGEVYGFAKGNFMNLGSAIALYAAVSAEMGKELAFPGSEVFYSCVTGFTDAKLHAEFARWVALEAKAANEAFNIVNGDAESWMNLWPRVAKHFGLEVPKDQFTRDAPLWSEMALQEKPPLAMSAEERGVAAPQSRIVQRVDLVKWAKQDDVVKAWKRRAQREGLDPEALEKASWAFAGSALGRDHNVVQSMSKARKLGWTGYRDSWENLEDLFGVLKREKVVA